MTRAEEVAQKIADAVLGYVVATLQFGPNGTNTRVFRIPYKWNSGFTGRLDFQIEIGKNMPIRIDAKHLYPMGVSEIASAYIAAEGFEVEVVEQDYRPVELILTRAPILVPA